MTTAGLPVRLLFECAGCGAHVFSSPLGSSVVHQCPPPPSPTVGVDVMRANAKYFFGDKNFGASGEERSK